MTENFHKAEDLNLHFKSVVTKDQHGYGPLPDKEPVMIMHDITITGNALLLLKLQHLQENWSRRNHCFTIQLLQSLSYY